jgi:hypothetical protein
VVLKKGVIFTKEKLGKEARMVVRSDAFVVKKRLSITCFFNVIIPNVYGVLYILCCEYFHYKIKRAYVQQPVETR